MKTFVTPAGKSLQVSRKATGGTVSDTIYWTATCSDFILLEDAVLAMEAEGFSTIGYGFFTFYSVKLENGSYKASWQSLANCS